MKTRVDQNYEDASKYLSCFAKTRHTGMYQKAIDRLQDNGIDVSDFREPTFANLLHLQNHLRSMGVVVL